MHSCLQIDLGVDRVICSICMTSLHKLTLDALHEKIEESQAWFLDESALRKIGRDNAIKLLNLPLNLYQNNRN
jgi:hypothetical protein